LGCTKGVPTFSTLDGNNIPQPMFLGATQETLNAASTAETFLITGQCDPKIQNIAGSAVGSASTFSTLSTMSTTPVTINCASSGQFSFTLKSLSDLGFNPQNNQTYDVQLRAITSGGVSNPSTVHIAYSTANGPDDKHILVTSGSTLSGTGARISIGTTSFSGTIRVSHMAVLDPVTGQNVTEKTGSQFKMKIGVAKQND
jgi:hypothetical protein